MSELVIQQEIRAALGREPDLTIWRNETGQTSYVNKQGKRRHLRYGLCVGSADIVGILAPTGRFIALEIKTSRGRPSAEQVLFLQLIRNRGGFAAIVRSVNEARAAIARAREGLSE